MRNLLFLARVVVVSFIVSLQLYAQPYPTTSYQLDEEGKTIVKWLGSEAELDLSSDPAFSAIETIGSKAFANCRDLKTIILPEKTTNIEGGAFSDCIYNHRTTKTNQKYPSVNL